MVIMYGNRKNLIKKVMKYEVDCGIIPTHRYKKEWLELQSDTEIERIEKMLRHLKESQIQNT